MSSITPLQLILIAIPGVFLHAGVLLFWAKRFGTNTSYKQSLLICFVPDAVLVAVNAFSLSRLDVEFPPLLTLGFHLVISSILYKIIWRMSEPRAIFLWFVFFLTNFAIVLAFAAIFALVTLPFG